MNRSRRIVPVLVALAAAANAAAQVPHQHHPPRSAEEYVHVLDDPSRDRWQQPERVMETLRLGAGQVVADIGSGSGYFTVRFGKAVGPEGRVYAVDIEQALLDRVAERAKQLGLANVVSTLAAPDDPKLPPASLDVVFICNTLHHIGGRDAYYRKLIQALKPGGRLVNVDFHKRDLPVGPPARDKIAKADFIREAEAAGFRLDQDLEFLEYQYFVILRRP